VCDGECKNNSGAAGEIVRGSVGMAEEDRKTAKNTGFWGPKNRGPRAPGRGVLRFSSGGYRNPVHILAKIGVFSLFLPI